MNAQIVIVLALATVACRGEGRSAPSESSTGSLPSAASPALAASTTNLQPAPSNSVAITPTADECTPGQKIAPATLAASWPTRLGTRVRFQSRIEVSLDVMDAVVTVAGQRFVVVSGPDQLWQGDKERTFTVMGSKTVSLGGRTTLPQLLLEPECLP